MPLTVTPTQALALRSLLTTKDWTVMLYLDVADGFELPVYVR